MAIEKDKYMKTLETLTEFLGSSEEQSAEEIKKELREESEKVDVILESLKQTQKKISMAAKRSVLDIAREKRLELENLGNPFVGRFRDWSRKQIIDRIKELSEINGPMVTVAYRELEFMGDETIGSMLEDLELTHYRRSLEKGDNGK
jgi:hypothetical protein